MKALIYGRGAGKTYDLVWELLRDERSGLLVSCSNKKRNVYDIACKIGLRRSLDPRKVNDAMKRVFVSIDHIAGTSVDKIMIDDIEDVLIANRPISFISIGSVNVRHKERNL